MKVGIVGSSDVAKALARAFLREGHEVKLGSREPGKLGAWVSENGGRASAGTFSEAAQFGELVVVAVLGTALDHAVRIAGSENFKGKTVIDVTNPLDFSKKVPKLVGGPGASGGEKLQQLLPGAFVVKSFNTVGHALFYQPAFSGVTPDMFLCGDNDSAKNQVCAIIKRFGWNPIDVGGIETSHYLEATAMVWILTALRYDQWTQAYKLLRI